MSVRASPDTRSRQPVRPGGSSLRLAHSPTPAAAPSDGQQTPIGHKARLLSGRHQRRAAWPLFVTGCGGPDRRRHSPVCCRHSPSLSCLTIGGLRRGAADAVCGGLFEVGASGKVRALSQTLRPVCAVSLSFEVRFRAPNPLLRKSMVSFNLILFKR